MEWVNLTMEIVDGAGVELDEAAIGRVETVRDLLRAATEAGEAGTTTGVSPIERPEEALDEGQKRWLEPLSPAQAAASRAMFAVNRALMLGPFRLRVEGLENLPKSGPFVIAPNHVSYLDSFALAAALYGGRLRGMYWAGWVGAAFGNPLTRLVSRLARVVPVDPARAGSSSLAFGAAVLGRGKSLVWFPEGERSWTGELGPFKAGIGVLLGHYRVPVVPVFVEGTYEAMPRGSALVRPRRVAVTFGRPLDVDELELRGEGEEPRARIIEALRDRVAGMGEAARDGAARRSTRRSSRRSPDPTDGAPRTPCRARCSPRPTSRGGTRQLAGARGRRCRP